MAYFLWDDEGIAQFMRHFEPEIEGWFYALPNNVERSDVFRVLVSKWIGGVVCLSTLSSWKKKQHSSVVNMHR